MSTLRIRDETATSAGTPCLDGARIHASERLGGLIASASQLIGTHAVCALVGLASLPILARNLGPARYGQFSLFVTMLGVVTYQDFIRPLLIRQWSATSDSNERERMSALATATTWTVCGLAACVGLVLLTPLAAFAFTLAAGAHALASIDYARLAASGRVGAAGAIRNIAFASALVVVTASSFLVRDQGAFSVHAYAWPFVACNLAILLFYRRLSRGHVRFALGGVHRSALREAWREHRRTIVALVGFSLATAVVVCADRVILGWFVDAETFGAYAACADLAVKLTIAGTAVGSVLYPAMARAFGRDTEQATRRFVGLASLVMLGWFVLVITIVVFHRTVIAAVLGPSFAADHALYAWILVGTFVHMLGFLLTPWQRARGDFATQTSAYWIAACAMVAVGFALVPRFGVAGAAACYLTARTAELLILSGELRWVSRAALPRWKVALLGAMIAAVAGAAWLSTGVTP